MNPENDLLARYLQAVGDHLPAASRDDVLAELRANLQAQLEDRAEEMNRPLTDADVADLLRAHGRPLLVAARYSPQQYLIGPAIFPYYVMTLRKAAPFVLVIVFLANCSNLVFAHTGPELIAGILRALGQLVPDLIYFAAWMTVAFAIAEHVYVRNCARPFLASWDPTKLPAIKQQFKQKLRASRIADLIFHCLWMVYVVEIPSHPYLILGPGEIALRFVPMAFAPIWHTIYLLILITLVLQLLAKILALSSTLHLWESALGLLTKLFGVATTAFLATVKIYFVATGPATNPAVLANINHWANFSLRIILLIAVIDLLVACWKLRPRLDTKILAF